MTRRGGRVTAVDLARAVALLGMMLAHLGPPATEFTPPINEIVTSGRAAPLFALLAGVSLSLVQRRDPRGVGSVLSTVLRGVLLFVLGLSLGSITEMPVLIILCVYGLLIVAALLFRGLPTTALVATTVVWAVAAPVALLAVRIHVDPVYVEQPSWSDVADPWRLIGIVTVWGGYPAVVWMTYVLAGLVIGRLDLGSPVVAARLAGGGALLAAVPLLVAWQHDRTWQLLFMHDSFPYEPTSWEALWFAGPHSSMPLDVLSATGSAALVVGVCALVVRPGPARRLLHPLIAAGSMTLTLYTLHVLWTWWRYTPEGGGIDAGWSVWWLQGAVLVTAAALWRLVFPRGPIEQVMRLLSVRPSARRTRTTHERTPAVG